MTDLADELLAGVDRWKPYLTAEQIAAVMLVLFCSDEVPTPAAMEHYRQIGIQLKAVAGDAPLEAGE